MTTGTQSTQDYLAAHHIFTIREFEGALPAGSSPAAAKHRLDHAVGRGWAERVMRGVYVSRFGLFATRNPDSLVLASKLGPDAVISHASALVALGLSHNVLRRVTFSSTAQPVRRTYRGYEYVRLKLSGDLAHEPALTRHTLAQSLDGVSVRITSRERTLVECLADPQWGGGLEMLLRSVGAVPSWRLDDILDYLDLLGSPTVVARTAWVLTLSPSRWRLDNGFLQALRDRIGVGPYYLGDRESSTRFVAQWRLYVPDDVEAEEWLSE